MAMHAHLPANIPADVEAKFGRHHRFNIGVFEAIADAERQAPAGWRVAYCQQHAEIRDDAVIIGDVKVRTADPAFILYAYPIQPTA